MYQIKYLLKEEIDCTLVYFSESTQKEISRLVAINSIMYDRLENAYLIGYGKVKISAKKILFLEKENEIIVNQENINIWINEIIKNTTIEDSFVPQNITKLNFSSNWVKDKILVLTGDRSDEWYLHTEKEKKYGQIIKDLGGVLRGEISAKTNILIIFDEYCEHHEKYKTAMRMGLHIVNLEELLKIKDKY